MERIAAIIAVALVCLPAWAGTFREDFSRGDLAGWQFQFIGGRPDIVTFQVENEQLNAEMDLALLVKKGDDPRQLGLEVNMPRNSTWLYSPIQLEGDDFSVSCRLQFAEGIESQIGIALQTDEPKWDTYMIRLRSFIDQMIIAHNDVWLYARGLRLPLRPQVWYKLKVEVKPPNKELKVFVDDVLYEDFVLLGPQPQQNIKGGIPFPPAFEGRKLTAGFNLWGRRVKALFDDLVLESPNIIEPPVSIHPKSKLTTTWGKIKARR